MAETTGRIEIVNWGEFQHYDKRLPPWIKLHRSLLNKREWHELSGDASKLLAECWLVAAEHKDGWIEKSTRDLAWRLRRTDHQTALLLKELEAQGFIALINYDASDVLASCQRVATTETERETETDQSSVLSEQADEPPKVEAPKAVEIPTDKQHEGSFAGLVKKHLWLQNDPPALVLRKNPGWTMGREITIGRQWAKDYGGWPVVLALIPLFRKVLDVDADQPLSCLFFHDKESRHKISQVLGHYERQQAIDATRNANSFQLKRVG
jgi:hypothetical protein